MSKTFLMLLLFLCACHPDRNRPIDLNDFRLKTSDGARLYFDNVRKSSYDMQSVEDAGIKIYTMRNFIKSPLSNKIIHNWRLDRAYLQLVLQDTTQQTLFYKNEKNNLLDFPVSDLSFKEQTRTSLLIYNLILKDQTIFLDSELTTALIFDKELFRITSFDYLRLTDNR